MGEDFAEIARHPRTAAFDCDETACYPRGLSLTRAKGPFVWFEGSDEPLFDLIQGYSTTILGHCDDALVACAVDALTKMDHISGITSGPREALASRLAALTPVKDARVYFDVGGAQIVSQALRLGCRATGRSKILGLRNAFHGYSAEGEILSKTYIGGHTAGVVDETRIDAVEIGDDEIFDLLSSEQYGACVIEPIQGANGLIELPTEWVRAVHQRCRETGTPLVCDEVQVGLGRTGTFATVERYGIDPDMVTYGKGLCGGLFPLSALVVGERCYQRLPRWPRTALGSTFSCNPFACTLGVHVVDRVAELLRSGRIAARGRQLAEALLPLAELGPIESVRTYGMAIALDVQEARHAERFVEHARHEGLLVYACGSAKDVIKLYPPYNITDDELQALIERLHRTARRLASER